MNPLIIAVLAMAGEPSPRADALDLLLLPNEKSLRLEIDVRTGGTTVPAVWDDTFAKLHAYYDRNSDGRLNKTEAARLPSAFHPRQVLWGQFSTDTGRPPPFTELDLNADGMVSTEEVADFYRRAGLGGVLVGVGKAPATDKLTEAVLKTLDTSKDGKTDETEWKRASEVLMKLDANDDELVGPGELADRVAYPGANGSALLSAPAADGKIDPICANLPLVLLPLRMDDRYWMTALSSRSRTSKRPATDLATTRSDRPAVSWKIQLDGKVAASHVHVVDGLQVTLRTDVGKLGEQTASTRKRFVSLFAEYDSNSDGRLAGKELTSPNAALFQQLLPTADRDEDGTLSRDELNGWLVLQEQIARGHVLLTLIDHGTGLFELLDVDHDGGLGVRELRSAWTRLTAAGCVADGRFDRAKMPRQLLACVSHGHPQSAIGKPLRTGPTWLSAMDRNGDGDVSKREFTGPAELFTKLDLDGDGLLSASEANAAKDRK